MKIVLIGDSIRMGYQNIVKELLKDKADVIFKEEDNGRFVQYNLHQLNQLLYHNPGVDMVFFNSGYWDMNIEHPMDEAFNPIPIYLEGLKRIIDLIKKINAKPVFLTTPPIYNSGKSIDNTGTNSILNYKNEWVVDYNEHALKLMKENDVDVIDVFDLCLKSDKYYKCNDFLHLTYDGYLAISKEIVKKVLEYE